MADKFVNIGTGGNLEETEGTVISTGAPEAGDLVSLDGTGKLDTSVMPTGIGADTKAIVSSENLSAGDFVNVWDDAGTLKARKADATTTGKRADGFVVSAVTAPANATVYFEGINDQLSALTLGGLYYLATTAGAVTTTVPSTTGNVRQYIGKAVSLTEIAFEADEPITRA